uniref:Uncharacterized protein n=1 Tax=Plectus sambesii TaxID=2011161 RepID=A0A914WS88_9BILA
MVRHGKKRNAQAAKVIIDSPTTAEEEEIELDVGIAATRSKRGTAAKRKAPRRVVVNTSTIGNVTRPDDVDEDADVTQYDVYITNLRGQRKAILLTDRRSAALADCDDIGQLVNNAYVIVRVLDNVVERQATATATAIVCSCPSNAKRREYLQGLQHQPQSRSTIRPRQDQGVVMDDCIHGRAVRHVLPGLINPVINDNIDVTTDGSTFDCLQGNLLVYAVKCVNGTFGVVRKGTSRLRCITCGEASRCLHVATLQRQAKEQILCNGRGVAGNARICVMGGVWLYDIC